MSVRKYDWIELRKEWLSCTDRTVTAFCDRKGLPDPRKNSFIAQKTKGWVTDKNAVMTKAIQEFAKSAAGEMMIDTREVRLRQAKMAAEVIEKAMEYLRRKSSNIRTVDEATKLLVAGTKMEREALGINDKNPTDKNETNITIYASKFGDILDNQDEAGLTNLITSIRKLKRARTPVSGEPGSGEIRQISGEPA